MKLKILIALTLLTIFKTNSQKLEQTYINTICDCYTNLTLTEYNTKLELELKTCFESGIISVQDELEKLMQKESLSAEGSNFEQGYEFGYKWAQQTVAKKLDSLVDNCDGFYKALSISRKHSYIPTELIDSAKEALNAVDLKLKTDSLNDNLRLQKSLYTVISGDFENGRESLYDILENDKNNFQAIMIIALAYEYEGKHKLALANFIKANTINQDFQFRLAIAFLKRRINEEY